ncbi:MAG: hypothetical protein H6835_03365 [Planctomycetes bacterium]|nr:hypothetical protein [Planctomycetota bacterium]
MRPKFVFGDAATTRRTAGKAWVTSAVAAILFSLVACHDHSSNPPAVQVLDAPVVSSVTTEDGAVEVAWSEVDGALSYNFYWQHGDSLDVKTCDCDREMERLRHRVTGLHNGNAYSFAVSANNRNGEGPLSEVHTRTLAPDMVLEITATPGEALVQLDWAAVDYAAFYVVYRDTTPGTAKATGVRIAPVAPPYLDQGLTNGTTYYYVVAAVGVGGEGVASSEVSAKPDFTPPESPTLASVTLMEEAPNTLVIEWSEPATGPVDSYNLYWDVEPNVTTADNLIADVTSPYVHSGLAGQTPHYYVVTAVANGLESQPSLEVSATPRGNPGGGGGGGGGGDETASNNLALPVLFVDGYGLSGAPLAGSSPPWFDYATGLRPLVSETVNTFPLFQHSSAVVVNGTSYYPQKTDSTWQAQWQQAAQGPVDVIVDWGDNLTTSHLTPNSNIRIETVLYQDTTGADPAPTMTGYQMTLLGGSGITELYGTDGTTYASNRWHVFATTARLTIEKLTGPGGPVDPDVQGFSRALYEGFGTDEGGSTFGSEVNVSGKLVYGYIWMLKKWPLTPAEKTGWWRITFSLDPVAQIGTPPTVVNNHVFLTGLDPSETIATIDPGQNRSSIEIQLQ